MNRSVLIFLVCLIFKQFQAQGQHIPNWQNKDLATDSLFGISTEKAYDLLKSKKPSPVIVAVIDAGSDTTHEDLKKVLWVNPKKKAFDSGTYGWSFIGSTKGNVRYDNIELTRQVRQFEQRDTNILSLAERQIYHQEKLAFQQKLLAAKNTLNGIAGFRAVLQGIENKLGKADLTIADLQSYQPSNPGEVQVRQTVLKIMTSGLDYKAFKDEQLDGPIAHLKTLVDYHLNTGFDPREIVGDDYLNSSETKYGSADVMGPDAEHGTHVAGIIAAERGNGLGIDGIADQAKILTIRAVPDGDERDKDIANAIRYAADHGARVINMSFGKAYSQDKSAVDKAIAYALKKDILLIQAAGNDNKNIDSTANFPRRLTDRSAYIVVGASGLKDDNNLKAPFSNYGKTSVDVFAPGVRIYSTVPGSKYAYHDGTSMAAPVVAGLAALILEYYPKLKANEVKEIILSSVNKRKELDRYCLTSGVVNAYQALLLADAYKK